MVEFSIFLGGQLPNDLKRFTSAFRHYCTHTVIITHKNQKRLQI